MQVSEHELSDTLPLNFGKDAHLLQIEVVLGAVGFDPSDDKANQIALFECSDSEKPRSMDDRRDPPAGAIRRPIFIPWLSCERLNEHTGRRVQILRRKRPHVDVLSHRHLHPVARVSFAIFRHDRISGFSSFSRFLNDGKGQSQAFSLMKSPTKERSACAWRSPLKTPRRAPGASQPGVSHPGASQPDASQPNASQPDTSRPMLLKPLHQRSATPRRTKRSPSQAGTKTGRGP